MAASDGVAWREDESGGISGDSHPGEEPYRGDFVVTCSES